MINCHLATATATAMISIWYHSNRRVLARLLSLLLPNHCHSPSHVDPVHIHQPQAKFFLKFFTPLHSNRHCHRHSHSHTMKLVPFEPPRSCASFESTTTKPLPPTVPCRPCSHPPALPLHFFHFFYAAIQTATATATATAT
jgi:hypothetical protein